MTTRPELRPMPSRCAWTATASAPAAAIASVPTARTRARSATTALRDIGCPSVSSSLPSPSSAAHRPTCVIA